MEPRLHKSRFATHYNRLMYLGMWTSEMLHPTLRKLFPLYCMMFHILLIIAITLQMIDLYMVFGNLRKVTFNFCTSGTVLGYTIIMIMLYDRKDYLNGLRESVWRDSLELNTKEETEAMDEAYSNLKNIRNWYYSSCLGLLPLMIISSYYSYLWGPRELPFAGYFPIPDPMDDSKYLPALAFETFCAFYVIFVAMESELGMFGIILQMNAYYKILINNIGKINGIYADEHDEGYEFRKEVNALLKKTTAKKLLKASVIRHMELIEYSETFEYIYSRSMFVRAFAGALIIVMNGIEVSMFVNEISVKLCFQLAYISMVIVDLLFICIYLSRLSSQCSNVGNAAYSTFWYKMDPDIRKELCIIILRCTKPPRITGGKFFVMDLHTFLHLMSNIYSWLMLMRRVLAK